MSQQYLQFIREELMIATADLSGRTKGQLVAFAESGMARTDRLKRKRRTMLDEMTGDVIAIYGDPVPGTQTRGKGSSVALIEPVQFCTASWRRALTTLDNHERAWLSWCYAGDLTFAHQMAIARWVWAEFKAGMGGKRVTAKTMKRLQALVWLAAQDVKSELAGRDVYQYADLAALVGVAPDNWSKNYVDYWETLLATVEQLDRHALLSVARTRSQHKLTFSQPSIAKVN
jgi:hypothetical protein